MAHSLTTVKEWVPQLADPGFEYHGLLEDIRDQVQVACVYCARADGVKDAVEAAGIPFLDDYKGHPSVRDLMVEGRQVVTF